MFMRRQFVWWSLHPAGYALSTNLIGTDYIWFGLVLSSSVKLVLIRYGGLRLYWKAIPFFIGLVFGEYAVVTVLNVISIIFQDSDLRSLDIPILVAKATMHKSKGRESKIMLSYQRVKDKRYRNWLSQINAPSPMSSGSEKARRSPSCPFHRLHCPLRTTVHGKTTNNILSVPLFGVAPNSTGWRCADRESQGSQW